MKMKIKMKMKMIVRKLTRILEVLIMNLNSVSFRLFPFEKTH